MVPRAQVEHNFQTAEGIRAAGYPEWMQLVGLVHDVGKMQFLWGGKASGVVCANGFERLEQCGQVFYNKTRDVMTTLHGDDFFTAARPDGHKWFDGLLRKNFSVKFGVMSSKSSGLKMAIGLSL